VAAHEQPQQRREREIRKGKKHPPMLPDPAPADIRNRKPSFETPHLNLSPKPVPKKAIEGDQTTVPMFALMRSSSRNTPTKIRMPCPAAAGLPPHRTA
jgi:hypothetical protein